MAVISIVRTKSLFIVQHFHACWWKFQRKGAWGRKLSHASLEASSPGVVAPGCLVGGDRQTKGAWGRKLCYPRSRERHLSGCVLHRLSRPSPWTGIVIRGDESRTNPVGTGAVDYDEIVARREPRLFGRKVASILRIKRSRMPGRGRPADKRRAAGKMGKIEGQQGSQQEVRKNREKAPFYPITGTYSHNGLLCTALSPPGLKGKKAFFRHRRP